MVAQEASSPFPNILDGLKSIYHHKIEPVEISTEFDKFYSSRLSDRDLDAKPMVLLLGQYSTGKTTFINYLLEGSYPGAHICPEPTVKYLICIYSVLTLFRRISLLPS